MNYIVSDTDMTSVADAIRTKGNTQASLEFPSEFVTAIGNLGGDATLAALIDRSITEIEIPNGVETISSYVFYNCAYLTSVLIPTSVRYIGSYAFGDCARLANINIPNNVIQFKTSAFSGCSALTSIELPSSMSSIQSSAFNGCINLVSITCKADNPPTLGNNVFNNVPAACAIYVPAASVDAYKAASGWSGRAAYIQAIPT